MLNKTDGNEIVNSYYYQIASVDGRNYGGQPEIGRPIFTQFTIDLYEPIVCFDNQSFMVSLSSMQFPYSFYTTNSTNNAIPCFTTNITTGLSSAPAVLILPDGNYTANTLITELTTQFDNTFSLDPTAPATLNMTYNATTNKFQFLVNQANTSATFTWTSNPTTNQATIQLGFTSPQNNGPLAPDMVCTNTPLPLGPFIDRSNASINVQPIITNIYLRTDLATDVSAVSNRTSDDCRVVDILQKIPANCPPNGWIQFYYQQMGKPTWVKKKSIQSIRFRITDKENNLIDTNYVQFTFTLKIDVVRRPAFLMPDFERRIDANPMLAGAGVNPSSSVGPLWQRYFDTSIYQDLVKDRGVKEGYHNWMMRKVQEQLPPQQSEINKRNKEQESGNTPSQLKSENK